MSFISSQDKKSKQYFQTCGNEEESDSERTDRFSKVMLFLADSGDPEKDDSDHGANDGDQKRFEDNTGNKDEGHGPFQNDHGVH